MNEWDANADRRQDQILSGRDLSYSHVLVPTILDNLPQPRPKLRRILDAGCGGGALSKILADKGWDVTGIDSSRRMVQLAERDYGGSPTISFIHATLEEYARAGPSQSFDGAVANMLLAGITELTSVLRPISELLKPGGLLVIADIHPCFWRIYRRHQTLDYWKTPELHEPFTISLDRTPLPANTTVVYRSLQELIRALLNAGFQLVQLDEPRPSAEVEQQYPSPWRYPRFIVVSLAKGHPPRAVRSA